MGNDGVVKPTSRAETADLRRDYKGGTEMQAYGIDYKVRGREQEGLHRILVDAKDLKSAKRKIGKKHGYKDGRMIQLQRVSVIGYY